MPSRKIARGPIESIEPTTLTIAEDSKGANVCDLVADFAIEKLHHSVAAVLGSKGNQAVYTKGNRQYISAAGSMQVDQ